jgi:hypothetical protein
VSDFVKLDDAENELPFDAKEWTQVLDRETGLIWTADDVVTEPVDWYQAKRAAALCRVGNSRRWRLPTRKELVSLIDDTRHGPAIDAAYFPKTKSDWYWSASPCAWSPGSFAWIVLFSYGNVSNGDQNSTAFVRAVRSRAKMSEAKESQG